MRCLMTFRPRFLDIWALSRAMNAILQTISWNQSSPLKHAGRTRVFSKRPISALTGRASEDAPRKSRRLLGNRASSQCDMGRTQERSAVTKNHTEVITSKGFDGRINVGSTDRYRRIGD